MSDPHSETSRSYRLVEVFTTYAGTEGLVARGLLQSEGIPVVVKGESQGPYRMGGTSLWVPDEFEVQARLILAEALEGGLAENDSPDPAEGRSGW